MSFSRLAAILGSVFGGVALLGLIIGVTLCIVCKYKIKKGDWICLQVRPGKYTIVTKAKMERIRQQQQQQQQMQQQISTFGNYNTQFSNTGTPGAGDNVAYTSNAGEGKVAYQ
jgi:hypothetical protein